MNPSESSPWAKTMRGKGFPVVAGGAPVTGLAVGATVDG